MTPPSRASTYSGLCCACRSWTRDAPRRPGCSGRAGRSAAGCGTRREARGLPVPVPVPVVVVLAPVRGGGGPGAGARGGGGGGGSRGCGGGRRCRRRGRDGCGLVRRTGVGPRRRDRRRLDL